MSLGLLKFLLQPGKIVLKKWLPGDILDNCTHPFGHG